VRGVMTYAMWSVTGTNAGDSSVSAGATRKKLCFSSRSKGFALCCCGRSDRHHRRGCYPLAQADLGSVLHRMSCLSTTALSLLRHRLSSVSIRLKQHRRPRLLCATSSRHRSASHNRPRSKKAPFVVSTWHFFSGWESSGTNQPDRIIPFNF